MTPAAAIPVPAPVCYQWFVAGEQRGEQAPAPVPAGAATRRSYDLLRSLQGEETNPIGVSHIDGHQWAVLGIGFVIAFIVAYASVAWFMAWVRKRGSNGVRRVISA